VNRSDKQQVIASLHETLKQVQLVVITRQSGLTVAEATNLRRQMRQAGAGYKVTKNRLARLALDGTQFEGLKSLFTGPTAIAYSQDPVAAAKVAVTYANSNDKLKIVGGAMGGQLLDSNGVKALATLPSLDELRAKLIGVLRTPATRIAAVLQAPGGQLARVLKAYAAKGDAA
jgi:large subunit ribosomal protein L10